MKLSPGWPSVVLVILSCLLTPSAARAQGTADALISELESGDGTRCMDAGNATSQHQEHYTAMAAKLAPGLLNILETDGPCASSALSALLNIGPGAAEGAPADRAVPVLVKIIERGTDPEGFGLRNSASSAILVVGNYGADAGPAVPVIERWIRSSADYSDRRYGLMALSEIGDPAAPAVPLLLELFAPSAEGDENAYGKEELRREVVQVLGRIPSAAAQSGPVLAAALRGEDWPLIGAASDALASLGAPAVQFVVPLLSDSDESVREGSMKVLVKMGAAAADAAPQIAAHVADENWNVRYSATEALSAIGPTPAVVKALVELVEAGRSEDATTEAMKQLASYGNAARAALPALRKVAAQAKPNAWSTLADAAVEAIKRIEANQ